MPTTIAHRSPFKVPRWTEAQAREVIAALERSGKPVSVFAAEHGLDPQRVYQWRRRVAGGDPTMFREIVVRPSDPRAQGSSFEVVLATGDIIRVPPSFDEAALARLLDVLVRARAC
jgi:transposase-like protein